jgi:hypothetical protein
MSNPARIDVHQHIIPPDYANWLTQHGIKPGGGSLPKWSVEDALNVMDEHGIATGILSVSTPGVHLGNDAEARIKAREVNEFAAKVVSYRPHRFGFFATLTLT